MGIWNDLLTTALSGGVPHKTVFLVGGSKEVQNSFIKLLFIQHESFLQSVEESPIANSFDIGYTNIQYKDDSKDMISNLQVYTLPVDFQKDSLANIISNIQEKDIMIVNLFDYSENPHQWMKDINSILFKFKKLIDTFELLQVVINKQIRFDWDQEAHEYIQLSLRVISLLYGGSLIYMDLNRRSTKLIDLISTLLNFPVREGRIVIEPNLVDSSNLLIPKDIDTWGKIKTLHSTIEPEELSKFWELGTDNEFIKKYEAIVPVEVKKSKLNKTIPQEKSDLKHTTYQEFLSGLYNEIQREKKTALATK